MVYQVKFSQLQKKFLITCSLFHELRYKDISSIWEFAGGLSSKPPSSLIKKSRELGILTQDNTDGIKNTKYIFNKQKIDKLLLKGKDTRIGYKDKGGAATFSFEHDLLLQRIILLKLPLFKGYELSFPVDKSFERLVPDAIMKESQLNHSVIVEFDNDTERRFDFVSKLPRFAEEYSHLKNNEKVDIIFVFKGSPINKMVTFINTITLTRTFTGESIKDWLNNNPKVNMYFITEYAWSTLTQSIVSRTSSERNEKVTSDISGIALSSLDIKALYYYNLMYYLSFETGQDLKLTLDKIVYSDLQDLPLPNLTQQELLKIYSIIPTKQSEVVPHQINDGTTSLFN